MNQSPELKLYSNLQDNTPWLRAGGLVYDLANAISTGYPTVVKNFNPDDFPRVQSLKPRSTMLKDMESRTGWVEYAGVSHVPEAGDFAIFEIPHHHAEIRSVRRIMLPVTQEAALTTFRYLVPVDVNNRLYPDAVIQPDDKPFVVGGFYRDSTGRILRIEGQGGGANVSFFDQYGVHRYHKRSYGVGRVTGSAHDFSDPTNIGPQNRPEGLLPEKCPGEIPASDWEGTTSRS